MSLQEQDRARSGAQEKLRRYLNNLPTEAQRIFASKCETTVGQMRQVCYGNRDANPALAVNIDRETGGAVPMTELAPEVDWNHVRTAMRRRK